jgi:hypothetical protein
MTAPILFRWSGETMEPLPRFHNICNAEFTVGEVYRMQVEEERSQVSHNHYFAELHEKWLSLPENTVLQFASDEHLRKHALIMTGYRDERSFVCASKAEALRLAAFLKPVDEYAVISVAECAVIMWTAKSQSRKAMGGKVFQKSKQDVFDFVDALLGTDPLQAHEAAA